MQTEQSRRDREIVNNGYYDTLGDRWSSAEADPVALLRAEGKLKNGWVSETLRDRALNEARCLDIGCGGGFLTHHLAREGHRVTGLDLSGPSLEHARAQDATGAVRYVQGDAYRLPFEAGDFDVVTCFDFLEHVSEPERVVAEASRVLRPGGLFFYHTFSRNPLAYLIVIKGLEWFVRGTPEKLHVYPLFIRPRELSGMMGRQGLRPVEERGIRPRLGPSFWRMLMTGRVDSGFEFRWSKSRLISYAGWAEKSASPAGAC